MPQKGSAAEANAPKESVTLIDNSTGNEAVLPLLTGTDGPKVLDIRKLYAELGYFTYDPGFVATGSCESKITYIDGDEGILLHRGYPIEELAEKSDFMEVCYLLLYGELPNGEQKCQVRARHHPPHDAARADQLLLSRLPARRAPDGDHVRRGRRAVGLLSRLHRHHRSAPAHGRVVPADRQDADDRGLGLQVLDRPALHVSAQRPELRRELPPHDVRHAVREVQGQPGPRQGDGPHLDPARRPRAERLDLDRAPRRLVGREPVRLHRGRHRQPVGPRPRRRQRGRAQHADGDRRQEPHRRVRQRAPRTRTIRSA